MGEGKAQRVGSQVIVDAIEGEKARVEIEPGLTVDWDRASLPAGVKAGDVIRIEGQGEDQHLELDRAATRQRREQAQDSLEALNQNAPKGDLDL
ncbi:DUF3006 domain-containing protein [Deinococcus cavernae]|uniref:DUF3006 domain-containing protein n=1 Tax=Deinococcus cavernae TaxID=2320857 RepID=A0A418VHP7_9DEIO|nr:DUF3006 domain-containing protein [Deinococcus cavernae]RJF75570.1 DUF3006 domain-containing protein [Deinococcus cavernae]